MLTDASPFLHQRLFTIQDLRELGFVGDTVLSQLLKEKYKNIKVKELDNTWSGEDDVKQLLIIIKAGTSSLDSVVVCNSNFKDELDKQYDKDFTLPYIKVSEYYPLNEHDDSFFIVDFEDYVEEYYNFSEVENIITTMRCKPIWVGEEQDRPVAIFKWFDPQEIDDE